MSTLSKYIFVSYVNFVYLHMGKTKVTYKGKKYRQKSRGKGRKASDKKFFGFTSGAHSRGITDREIVDGKVVYTKSDRAPKKGEDFVKYGWPMETRKKKVIRDKETKESLDEEVNDVLKNKKK